MSEQSAAAAQKPSMRPSRRPPGLRATIDEFLALESAGGILLVAMAVLAVVIANTPLYEVYQRVLDMRVAVIVGKIELDKTLLLWINDGLMAVFFFLVGLEVKRELVEGELSSVQQAALPAIGAVGGLAVPAVIYWFFNKGDAAAMNGWAIPTATDIAFALGVLSLLGSRVPVTLKILLMAIAIVDDIAAIIIIALFYSGDISALALGLAAVATAVLFVLNRRGVARPAAYILVGVFMWVCVIKSGVHATLAGVVTALFIPLKAEHEGRESSPAKHLEHILHPWVAFMIMPVFAFANAGVSFEGLTARDFVGDVPMGIFTGLFLGKQIGIFGAIWLATVLGIVKKPAGASWTQIWGISLLAGIGFTMSLFIGNLAFEHGNFEYATAVRVGVFEASILSGVLGYLVLRLTSRDRPSGTT
jgi:NhaA family Na+:H+ antiporter